jgi:hypothetical protein
VLEPTKIGVEYVTRNESGSDPAGDRLQFAVTDQRANVVLGAAELGGNLAHCQGCGPLHIGSIACGSSIEFWPASNCLQMRHLSGVCENAGAADGRRSRPDLTVHGGL